MNHMIEEFARTFRFTQNFALFDAPWTNGSIKVVNVKLLKLFKSMISEYRLQYDEWGILLPMIEHFMNNFLLQSNLGPTPNEMFMGKDCYKETTVLVDSGLLI